MSKTEQKRLSIVARPAGGFRRAGFNFKGDAPTILNVEDLSEDQIELLKTEPNLVVTELAAGQKLPAPVVDDEALKAVQAENTELKAKLAAAVKDAAELEDKLTKADTDLKEAQKALKEAQKTAKK